MGKAANPRIRMLTSIGGNDFSLSYGEETDRFSQKEAIRYIERGQAVPVSGFPTEKAVRKAPEKRAKAPAKGKGLIARAKDAIGIK